MKTVKILSAVIMVAFFLMGCIGGSDLSLMWKGEYDSVNVEPEITGQVAGIIMPENITPEQYGIVRRYCGTISMFQTREGLQKALSDIKERSDAKDYSGTDFFVVYNGAAAQYSFQNGILSLRNDPYGADMVNRVNDYEPLLAPENIGKQDVRGVFYFGGFVNEEYLLLLTDKGDYVFYMAYSYTSDGKNTARIRNGYLVPLSEFILFAQRVVKENDPEQLGFGPSEESVKTLEKYKVELS